MSYIVKDYKTVNTKELVNEVLSYIKDNEVIAYDVEATGINPRKDSIIGFSVSAHPGKGYYIPTKVYNPETDSLESLFIEGVDAEKVAKVLVEALVGKKICMHNGVYDCEITRNYYGISLIESLWVENLVLVHTVAEEGAFGFGGPFQLKSIAKWKQKEFKLDAEKDANEEQLALKESIKKNGGSATKTNMEMYKADLDVLCTYGAADADLTIRSVEHFLPILKEEGLWDFFFTEEVMPVYRQLTYPMETRGVKLNLELLEQLREDIQKDIESFEKNVLDRLMSLKEVQHWVISNSSEKFPYKVFDEKKREYEIKKGGKNAQAVVNLYFDLKGEVCPLPTNPKKPDQWHITKGNVQKYLTEGHSELSRFFLEGDMEPLIELDQSFFLKCSMALWKDFNDGHYVKISSKHQLKDIVFNYLGEEPLSFTDKGSPQFNDDYVETIKDKYDWANDLYIFNRLSKIKSSYFDKLWFGREGDRYYFNFKQHGTISGRYGSDAQQMPRPMEEGEDEPIVIKYSNEVRALMIPDDGWFFIDADYESLEPMCFSHTTKDEGLKNIYRNGHDFYSTIAIATEKLEGVSPDKKADNYLKKVNAPKRQTAKAYCLDGDTLIKCKDFLKKIKHIKEGDVVKSEFGFNKVIETFKRQAETCIIRTQATILRCTLDHKFYLNGDWVEAKDLKEGDLLSSYLSFWTEDELKIIEIAIDKKLIDVYDLTVANEHNFFANGILVHNCLGVPYGMTDYALAMTLDVPVKEASKLRNDYLDAYPKLKEWMEWSNQFVKENGYIKNELGRVRHLPEVKRIYSVLGEDSDQLLNHQFRSSLIKRFPDKKEEIIRMYRDYKNGLNNAKNFQIQSLGASIVNRAGLGVLREARKLNIEVYPVAQIHDQWIFTTREIHKEEVLPMVQNVMETETKISIDLKAPPEVAYNWRDGH